MKPSTRPYAALRLDSVPRRRQEGREHHTQLILSAQSLFVIPTSSLDTAEKLVQEWRNSSIG
jgi:hypothetical protein